MQAMRILTSPYLLLMHRKVFFLFACCLFNFSLNTKAQEARWFKHQIATLCGGPMAGRGYVDKGRDKAAAYIQRRFREAGLQPIGPDSAWSQAYSFPVNIFPGVVALEVNGKALKAGEDFLVDAASSSFRESKIKISRVDVARVKTAAEWEAQKAKFGKQRRAWFLSGADSLANALGMRSSQLAADLPKGAYIIPQRGKMNWTVATDTIAATVFYVQDSIVKRKPKRAAIEVQAKLEPALKSSNIFAQVRGAEVPDSFIVITAHYDHLGKMGDAAVFPGASDNASGTAMLLWLACYYAAHPQRYSLLFIAFSGEEAGLLGSKHFVEHPVVPLAQMRFLINLDIMGDASSGVTVVNATEYPKEFALLQSINGKKGYLPEVRSRGKAANSDHYRFSESGVPAFFLYSNGGAGYYHDVFDKPAALSLNNIPQVAQLLQDFIPALQAATNAQ
jgi:hypothetical protein